MPRPKYCQHPTRRATFTSGAKGVRAVSLKLSMSLISRYDITDTRVHWLCPRCHTLESSELKIHQPMQINNNRSLTDTEYTVEDISSGEDDDDEEDADEEISYDNLEDEDVYMNDNMEAEIKDNDKETDAEPMDEESDDVSYDLEYHQNEAIEKLSTIFRLLNIKPIQDKVAVRPIRAKIDEVYRYLHGLCDVLEGQPQYQRNFNSGQNQARRSLVLRKNGGVLAYSQCLRGNLPLSDATFDAVVKFYCEDDISRVSSNVKDTILINKQPVPVRFMEMTVLDAYRIFNERQSDAVARSTFNSLRPREVKIASPHETCMCTTHENMDLLLKAWNNYYQNDGAAAHFKNNASILNLVHHRRDFNLDGCWTFTVTGHGKAARDSIGAVLKSTARRATLSKNILLSTAKDFYEFSLRHQSEIANNSNKQNPGIHVFFLDSAEVEEVKERVIKVRSEQLRSSGMINGIRNKHEFQPINNNTVQCRLTSRST
ncbi:unnamed protein product [Rotaria socialis]|uniref:Uncharacterized protein n=1 Tax=Rotaria socialis TaxID=392032 RepID=A0A821DMA9_9BILA|nr:unnamed protein product [Rotaria socialis]